MSWAIAPGDVIPLTLMLAAVGVFSSSLTTHRPRWRPGLFLLLAAGFIFFTIEFGLVLLILAGLVGTDDGQDRRTPRRSSVVVAAVVVLTLATAAFLFPGFGSALLRPVSWIWTVIPPQLTPSSRAVFAVPGMIWPHACLTLVLAMCGWELLQRERWSSPQMIIAVLLTLIGVCFSRFLVLSVAGAAVLVSSTARPFGTPSVPIWSRRLVAAAAVLTLGLAVFRNSGDLYLLLVGGELEPSRVLFGQSGIRGPVLLLNLDDSREWQTVVGGAELPPAWTDRWDVFGDQYDHYAGLCRDLREIRLESYLQSDGTWGGYRADLRRLQPQLLVADIRDGIGLRNLSLSPDWRILSLDGQGAVFGRADSPRLQPRIQNTMRIFAGLEWPTRPVVDPECLVARDGESVRRVAMGLCAIRLPYAGLRVLSMSPKAADPTVRMWTYLELAHRVKLYTGEPSLLDQCRAAALAGESSVGHQLTDDERRQLSYGLSALKPPTTDDERVSTSSPQAARVDDAPTRIASSLAVESLERALRTALLTGDLRTAAEHEANLPASRQDYYRFFRTSPGRSAAELYLELENR